MSDWVTLNFGMTGYRVFAALFPIYTPTSWADPAHDPFRVLRLPFFIYRPLYWWRDMRILYLERKIRNRRKAKA